MPTPELLAIPTGAPDFDQVVLLNEVIQKRQAEAHEAKLQLESARMRMTSERSQWSQQKADEEVAIRVRMQELEDVYARRMQQLEEDIRQAELSLAQQRTLEASAEQLVIEAKRRVDELDVLAKERVEVQQLKQQVEQRGVGLEERWADAQAMQSKGQDALKSAERMLAEVQQRTLALNERETSVKAREDAALLREHQAEIVEQELNKRLEAPLDTPSVMPVEGSLDAQPVG